MLQRVMHVFLSFVLVLLLAQSASAVSFGRIDVASHIGEPFYAEVPLLLDGKESVSKITVDLGSPADYRILEVYRDKVVNQIRTDIVKDARGARVKLSSEAPIDTAFFNLVLKVRYGRSTHFKKLPVFLESAAIEMMQEQVQPKVMAKPVNAATVQPETSDAFVTKVPLGEKAGAKTAFEEPVQDEQATQAATDTGFKPFSGWARTSRYGPMVYGDTITIVAKRLRVDDRFTNQQVMVALFEKNKAKFDKQNINLIKAGSYLDVPTAQEVSRISPSQAKQVLAEHNKAWKALMKQPKYAAVAQAQKTRYTRRVRIGQQATGVASAPMAAPEPKEKAGAVAVVPAATQSNKPQASGQDAAALQAAEQAVAAKDAELQSLKQKMAEMEARLAQAEKKAKEAPVSVDAAALEAQNKRLEIVVSRLKAQLEQAKAHASEQADGGWLMYALAGLGALALGLIGAIVMLLRRKPQHPAQLSDTAEQFDDMATVADTAPAPEADDDATMLMNADDFDMPSDVSDTSSQSVSDMASDDELEEIPDFTDDETGEIDAFDSDLSEEEEPDPSVNYLEEADVYMRYGMEDEAEKQVRMALKLDDKDPAAHAKLVQILEARGKDDEKNQAMETAKAVLAGGALASFEGMLASGDESSADDASGGDTASDIASLKDDFTGEDTGIVDFGEIDFGAAKDEGKDVMEPELLDTGEMDFGEVQEEAQAEDTSDEIDFTGIDFGETVTRNDSLKLDKIAQGDTASEVMQGVGLDTGDLDFGELAVEDEDHVVEAGENTAEEAEVDFDFSEMGKEDSSDESPLADDVLDQSIDLESFGVQFDEDEEEAPSETDQALDLTDDLEGTSAMQLSDETMAVTTDAVQVDLSQAMNDREVDQAIAEAEEAAKAVAVEVPDDAEDPFEAANAMLDQAEEDELADIANEDIDDVLGQHEDMLVLDETASEQGSDDQEAEDLESISLDFSGLDDEALDEVKTMEKALTSEVDIDDLDLSALDDAVSIDADEDDSPDVELELGDLGEVDEPLSQQDEPDTESETAELASAELDLDDFDLEEINLDDEVEETPASKPASDDFDATVILDKTQKSTKEELVQDDEQSNDASTSSFDSLDDALNDATLVMDNAADPMDDEFSATGELQHVEESIGAMQDDPMDSLEQTTELDGLMDDLKGLLDEDEPKK